MTQKTAMRYYSSSNVLSLLGYLVEGFLVRNETWTLIGSQLSMGKTKVSNVELDLLIQNLSIFLRNIQPSVT